MRLRRKFGPALYIADRLLEDVSKTWQHLISMDSNATTFLFLQNRSRSRYLRRRRPVRRVIQRVANYVQNRQSTNTVSQYQQYDPTGDEGVHHSSDTRESNPTDLGQNTSQDQNRRLSKEEDAELERTSSTESLPEYSDTHA